MWMRMTVSFCEMHERWRPENLDIISLNRVMDCHWHTTEHLNEITFRGPDGKPKRYNQTKYCYEYEFELDIVVDLPCFKEICMELKDQQPVLPSDPEYKRNGRRSARGSAACRRAGNLWMNQRPLWMHLPAQADLSGCAPVVVVVLTIHNTAMIVVRNVPVLSGVETVDGSQIQVYPRQDSV